MTTADEFELKWARYTAAVAKANDLNKAVVFDALVRAGITHVAVNFDGEGDSGQIENVAAHAGAEIADLPDTRVTLHSTRSGREELTTLDMTLREAVEDVCYGYLQQEHDGWENNDGAFGEFTFHVAERKITLEFNGRFTDYAHSTHAW